MSRRKHTKLLLDTHIWLWWQMAPERLSPAARRAVAASENDVYLSTVSTWEMAIKIAMGKLRLPVPLAQMVSAALLEDRMQSLPLQHHHCFELAALPLHHRDPFDRVLVAQARADGLTLVTAEPQLGRYELQLLVD